MKSKIKKVIAVVTEEYVEPDYIARWNCPYCNASDVDQVYDENCTETKTCHKCNKKLKVKIPKYF